jgi:hypothetical protein
LAVPIDVPASLGSRGQAVESPRVERGGGPAGCSRLLADPAGVMLHAARSETSSNSWKLSVISDASLSAWVDGTRSNAS